MIAPQRKDDAVLLTDEQMGQFIVNGFLTFKADIPEKTNAIIRERMHESVHRFDDRGNNLLPRCPELMQVFADPTLRGAVQSTAGPDAIMHPHRAIHHSAPQGGRRSWHKDSYWGYRRRMRNHRPWWVMIMYYPQDVVLEMGPTHVLPGRQYHLTREENDEQGCANVTGKAGTFFMIHYDLWHTADFNTSDLHRYMLKFEFVRMRKPAAPTWACNDQTWQQPTDNLPLHSHPQLWHSVWNWCAGQPDAPIHPDADLSAAKDLTSEHEPTAINAAYALASLGKAGLPALLDAVRSDHEGARRNAAYGLSVMGNIAAEGVIDAAQHPRAETRAAATFALTELDTDDDAVTNQLAAATRDDDVTVRLIAAEGLGMHAPATQKHLSAIIDRLQDDEAEVAFNATLALVRLGDAAEEAVEALANCLHAENRYVRGYAVDALDRIGTPEAHRAVIEYLKPARWCTASTPESPFYP